MPLGSCLRVEICHVPVFLRKVAQNLYNFDSDKAGHTTSFVPPHLKNSTAGDVLDNVVSKICCQDQYQRCLTQKTLPLPHQ